MSLSQHYDNIAKNIYIYISLCSSMHANKNEIYVQY